MSAKNKTRHGRGWLRWYIPLLLVELAAFIGLLMYGNNVAVINSKGFIAHEQRSLIILTITLLLAVAIPTMILLFHIAWKYRESSADAVHTPKDGHGKLLVPIMWIVPSVVAVVLALIIWPSTHRLEPHDSIASDKKPITIQVISMRWKWLFLYPDQKVATVNFVQIPKDTPVTFELTADESPMSSFWIPNLGGQLYSMTSHVNKLNLMADTLGDYPGSSAEINGAGFSGMKFTARVSSAEDFDLWVKGLQESPNVLDSAAYEELVKPSQNNPHVFYSSYDGSLYDNVVMKYIGGHESHTSQEGHE